MHFCVQFPNHLILSRLNTNIIDVGCMYSNRDVGWAMNEALVIKFGPMYLKITQDLTIRDAFVTVGRICDIALSINSC